MNVCACGAVGVLGFTAKLDQAIPKGSRSVNDLALGKRCALYPARMARSVEQNQIGRLKRNNLVRRWNPLGGVGIRRSGKHHADIFSADSLCEVGEGIINAVDQGGAGVRFHRSLIDRVVR